jgi:hypothetical protein
MVAAATAILKDIDLSNIAAKRKPSPAQQAVSTSNINCVR